MSPQVDIDVMCIEAETLIANAKALAVARGELKAFLTQLEDYREYVCRCEQAVEESVKALSALTTRTVDF